MQATSDYAKSVYGKKIEWAKKYGDKQVAHSFRKMTQEFERDTLLATVALTLDDILNQHAQCKANGVFDREQDETVKFSAITLHGAEGLSVRYPDGDNLLFAWKNEKIDEGIDHFEISVVPWKDLAPQTLIDRFNSAVAEGESYSQVIPLVKEMLEFSNLPIQLREPEYIIYEGLPLSMDNIRTFMKTGELGLLGRAAGLGELQQSTIMQRIKTWEGCEGRHSPLSYVEKIVSTFVLDANINLDKADTHVAPIIHGSIDKFFASTCAYALEHHLSIQSENVGEIVTISSGLNLTPERIFSHGDGDRWIYGVRNEVRDFYLHTNIDQGSCSYATVFNGGVNGNGNVDVYLAERWGSCFEENFGATLDDKITQETAASFVKYLSRDRKWVSEEMLAETISQADMPKEGLAFSYNRETKMLTVNEVAKSAYYLDYVPLMVPHDLEALRSLDSENAEELEVSFLERKPWELEYETIDAAEYLARDKGLAL